MQSQQPPQPQQQPPQSITFTDPRIIDFFKDSIIDPTKFILLAIQNKDSFLTIPTPNKKSCEGANITIEDLKRYKIDFVGLKKSQRLIKEKMNEITKLVEAQRLPFLEQSLSANRMIEKTTFDCPYCNEQTFLTKRALAGHTNKCRPLHAPDEEFEEEDEESVAENI
jgi:hypothetical protein